MKKWWIPLLALLLLLSGCGGREPDGTVPTGGEATEAPPTGEVTQPTQGSLYRPDSALEEQTDGAVEVYVPETGTWEGILPMGDGLLLFGGEAHPALTLLTGPELTLAVTAQLTGMTQLRAEHIRVGTSGVSYLDGSAGAVVFLNSSLRELSRLQMPEDMLGTACLSPDERTVYYCTRDGIRGLDLDTGISRLVKEQQAAWQSVSAVLLDGSVLRCVTESADGTRETMLVSAETGQTLREGNELEGLQATGEDWFLPVDRGTVQEYIFGRGEETPQNLWPEGDPQSVFFLPERNAAVAVLRETGGSRLDHYDLTTGIRTASVFLPGTGDIRSVCAAAEGSGIWFLAAGEADPTIICRWEPEMSPAEDSKDYTQLHYSQESPDEAGLSACQIIAAMLGEKYGVDIRIGPEAVKAMPDDYRFEQEYLVRAYEKSLPVLDRVMSQFPEDFFRTAAERTESGILHIGLVRSISGDPALGTLPQVSGVQYWLEGEAYLVLTAGPELERNFYHEMSHLTETRVLSVCTAYYDWETLNPDGFAYDNDYIANLDRQDHRYLEDEDRAFIDMFSMSYAKEDRARILEYACLPENGQYFRSGTMQKKLRMLCDGIRQAFGLEQEEPFLWEQYLREEPASE